MRTVRGRVFSALAAAALVSTVLTVIVASVVLHHQTQERRAQNLGRVADTVGGELAAALPGAGAGTVRVIRVGASGGGAHVVRALVRTQVLARVPAHGSATGDVSIAGRTVAYAARDTASGRIVLIAPSGANIASGPPPGRTVLLAGIGGLVVALLLAGALAPRLIRPVKDVAAAASRLAAGERDVHVDVSGPAELAQLGAAFNAMSADLQSAREAERAFLLSVSHELKTPLTAVRGYAEAIADGAVAPAEAAAVIGQEAARLERLVGDLLDLARLRQAGFEVAREPIDLAAVATAAVERHAVRARELGLSLRADVTGPAPGVGDAGRALQATSNLVENALRVARDGGEVVVHARPGLLEVRDDGPGIRAEHVPHAFERFYLNEHYRSDRPVGSGLGLALVADLVRGMGGSASLRSAPGDTAFTLRLDGGGATGNDGGAGTMAGPSGSGSGSA